MNKSKRFYFQVLLWFGIWIVLWISERGNTRFIISNIPAFIFQTLLLVGLIFYAAPNLLFKKKYLIFAVISFLSVLVLAFISSSLDHNLQVRPPFISGPPGPPDAGQGRPPQGASLFFIHILTLSLSYILATFIETFIFAQKKEEETIRNKSEKLQTELKFLKSQINPHFLFNSLNNIYSLSMIDSGKTQQSISYLSDMLRYVLYECEQKTVLLDKELTYINNYIKLFSLKSSRAYPITTNFKVMNPSIRVAPMLFIPFMENALKHSNIEKIDGSFIRIQIFADLSEIKFDIENTVPSEPSTKDDVGGIGIENVKRRLDILYPENYNLEIHETDKTFKVKLKINIHAED